MVACAGRGTEFAARSSDGLMRDRTSLLCQNDCGSRVRHVVNVIGRKTSVEVVLQESGTEAVAREGTTVPFAHGRGPATISILIPAHNEASFLPRCLRSLLRQNLSQVMRVIVIDNGSTDGTADVASQWGPQFSAAGHDLVVLHLPKGNKPAGAQCGRGGGGLRGLPDLH